MYNKSQTTMENDHKENFEDLNPGVCNACGGKLYFDRVSLDHYENDKLYVIEDVPAFVCSDCGEIWIPKPVIEELEKMISIYLEKEISGKTPKELLNG